MTLSRRTFLKGTLATSAVAASSRGCGNAVDPAPIVDVEVNDDPTSDQYGLIAVPVPKYPDLARPGGAVMLRLQALAPSQDRSFHVPVLGILLVHRGSPGDPPEFIATQADCPHQGCPLGYSPASLQIECPCHSSRFRAVADIDDPALCIGLITHAPAQSNLNVYRVTLSGDFVFVDLKSDLSCGVRSDIPPVVGGTVTVPVSAFPSLDKVGGTLVGKPAGLDDTLIVARVASDRVICLSVVCTHRGCPVKLELDATRMHCPCHDSAFAYDGAVLMGPATSPLAKYDVAFDGTVAVIRVK